MSSVTSMTWSAPKRSQRSSICSAMSSMRSNMPRMPIGPNAGISSRCALAQFGSSVRAVKRPSPAKSRMLRSAPATRLSNLDSSETSSTSACEPRKTTGFPSTSSWKIGPSIFAIRMKLWIGASPSIARRLPMSGSPLGFGIGMVGGTAAPDDRPLPASGADRVGEAERLHPSAHGSDVVGEENEVVELAVAIGDMACEQRLGAKAELLEDGDRGALVDRHLRDQLREAELERLRKALLDQRAAEPAAAPRRRDEHAQLADVLRPAQLVDEDRGAADHRAVRARDEAHQLAGVDRSHPRVDDLGMAEVARHEQQILRRQRRHEVDERRAVEARHARDLDLGTAAVDGARIFPFRFAHVDRPCSQLSSFGHIRFTAFAPAAMLTWPPGRTTSSLSREPTRSTSGCAHSGGTM